LAVALSFLSAKDNRSRWLLVALLSILTVTLGEEFFDLAGLPLGVGIGLASEFAIGPIVYLLVMAVIGRDQTPIKNRLLHFMPFAVACFWLLALNFLPESRWVSLSNADLRHWIAGTVTIKLSYILAYGWLALRLTQKAPEASDVRSKAIKWMRVWLYFYLGAIGVSTTAFFAFYLRVPLMFDSDYVGGLLLAATVYSLAYFSMANRAMFDRSPKGPESEEAIQHLKSARRYLETSGAARDPEFSLPLLAKRINLTESELSAALNVTSEHGFYGLLNEYRLRAFGDLAKEAGAGKKAILEIAMDAGFQSKATFYRVVKAETGMTPAEFRKSITR